ncbi:MAG: putative isoquinoline 1-oxidoreductase subunit beta IorB, molybdoprotein [Bryobacterales bacterium]|nr:putative isoquinoline 1-oxidoreductase subunit beta IorB, molybdoprotein [Bryobacterales bacterium]
MKPNRRDFLKTSGALIIGFSAGALRVTRAQGPLQGSPSMNQLDSWIAIAADGSITAYSGKEELGQGISTAQQQLVAEELSVPFNRVKLIYCDTAFTPDQAHTSGSQSHPTNFNTGNLAQAGATAREVLFRMASEKLGVPVEQLTVSEGVISSGSKRMTYGQLVGGKKFSLALDPKARRKPATEWTVLGKSIPRPDLPDLVTGRFEFVHNVRLPGMLHGRVVRPPSVGATVASVDESSVAGVPGVVKVVVKKNFVGVVAEKPWQAIQAAAHLKVTWNPGPALPDQATIYDALRKQPARDTLLVDSGDVDQKLSGATVLKATYLHPYQMHGSMGSSCAVADVQGEKATIYSATQAVWYQKNTSAMILGLKPENIRVIFRRGSGCYGVNGADTVTYDALVLSQAVSKPVRVQLTRRDEMAFENYGPAYVIDQRASVDSNGNITAWDHESWSPGLGGRPGTNTPGNIITGSLLGFQPAAFSPRSPAPAPGAFNNNSNGVPSYLASGTGTVQSGRVLTHAVESRFFTGPLRSPARLQNTFAHESFMDELAARVKADPVEYRLRHLRDARLKEVLQAAAKTANWESRPSPKPGNRGTGVAGGRGAACVLYEGDNGYTALVAEIEVNQDTGQIVVKRMVASSDVGPISNPDGLGNQVEGGALQGLSRALGEEVTWDNEKVTSVDWRTYHSLPLGFEVPKIEAVLINRTEGEVMGAGETSITLVAAAIGNAIFDATGVRLREVPFTAERIKAALATRG